MWKMPTHEPRPKKVAVYCRTSTLDQHPENQLPELERYVAARGWQIHDRYSDQVSGARSSRPSLNRLMADARRRRFDVVVCWSVSRFGRSMVNSVLLMNELTELGVALVFTSQGLDTGTTIGRGVVALLAALAEAELEERRERTRMGLRRARAAGKRLGRPKAHVVPVKHVEARLAAGESLRGIARDLGVPRATVQRQMRQAGVAHKGVSTEPPKDAE